MLEISWIDCEGLLVTFVFIKYRKVVEMIWSKWYQVTFWYVEFISQTSLTVSPSKMSTGLTEKFVWSGKRKQHSALLSFHPTSENHRIIWVGRTFKGPLVLSPCSEQGHLQLDQVAQNPIQSCLECFQGWGIDHVSGKPVPGFHHLRCKKFLPYI